MSGIGKAALGVLVLLALAGGADPKAITLDEAVRLIDEKAAKGPVKKKGRKATARKKAAK
jgi:DNA topoisomerase-1